MVIMVVIPGDAGNGCHCCQWWVVVLTCHQTWMCCDYKSQYFNNKFCPIPPSRVVTTTWHTDTIDSYQVRTTIVHQTTTAPSDVDDPPPSAPSPSIHQHHPNINSHFHSKLQQWRCDNSSHYFYYSVIQRRWHSYMTILDSFKFQVKIDHIQLLSSVNTFTAFSMYCMDYSVLRLQPIVPHKFTLKSEGGNDGPTQVG